MPIIPYKDSNFEKPDKSIPAKVLIKVEEFDLRDTHYIESFYRCPNCNKRFGNAKLEKLSDFIYFNYCYNCGQRLDWNDID